METKSSKIFKFHRPKLYASIFFVLLFGAYMYTYATPPTSPYQPGETLNPDCAPGDTDCFVQILPDQTGNNGKYLKTDGSVTLWDTIVSSQWTTSGSDIYYDTGKVGVGLKIPNGPFQVSELQYSTGTASQSGTTITGVGTTWTDLMIGSEFIFTDGSRAMITARASNTSLTADSSQTVFSQAYGIYRTGISVNPGTGDVSIGSIRNPFSNSRLFIYGGDSGSNIDARGLSGQFKDISQFEAEGNNYDSVPNSIAIKYFGSTAAGSLTVMGYDSNKLGVLDFTNTTTSLIRSRSPIYFGGGTSDLVTMTLDPTNQRLGIGTTSPDELLSLGLEGTTLGVLSLAGDTSGKIIIQPATTTGTWTWMLPISAGTNHYVLTTDGSGVSAWTDPSTLSGGVPSLTSTQIAFGSAGNLMTSSSDFTLSTAPVGMGHHLSLYGSADIDIKGGTFSVGDNGGGPAPTAQPAGLRITSSLSTLGDFADIGNGDVFTIDGGASSAYYDNDTHTGFFGINTTSPTMALDVVGDTNVNGNIGLSSGGTRYLGIVGALSGSGSDLVVAAGTGTRSFGPGHGGELKLQGGIGTGVPSNGGDVMIDGGVGNNGSGNVLLGSVHGNVGIGMDSPSVALDVVGSAQFNSNVGIGTAAPVYGYQFETNPGGIVRSVTNDVVEIGDPDGGNNGTYANFNDATQTLTLNYPTVTISGLSGTGSRAVLADASGVLSAPISDSSVKQNIQTLDYGLDTLMQLNPVSFEYIDGWKNYGVGKQIGFIAQDIEQVLPNSTFTTPKTGKMGYNEIDLVPVAVKAIQEMNIKIQGLSSLDMTNSNSLGSLIKGFLADAGNSLNIVFFGEVHAKKLCLEDVCITKDQLQQMLDNTGNNNQNSGGGSGGGGTGGDNPPPAPATDVCPNIDGDQATVPDGMHLDDQNNCVADMPVETGEVTPPDNGGESGDGSSTPPAEESVQ